MADVLLVAKLDRLTRSLRDFGELAERARKRRWALVCLDLGVDTTTPAGELVAGVVASTAQYERRLIGQRTREALAARRAAGVRLGRPARSGRTPSTGSWSCERRDCHFGGSAPHSRPRGCLPPEVVPGPRAPFRACSVRRQRSRRSDRPPYR